MNTTTLDISKYTICPFGDIENICKFDTDQYNDYIFKQIIFAANNGQLDYTIYDNNKRFGLLRNK
jgi:hypothetical protein